MGFLKYARAEVTKSATDIRSWAASSRPKKTRMAGDENLIDRASEIFGKKFNPDDYLLTHATIVCSVDTELPVDEKSRKIGRVVEDGRKIDRRFANYRVKPECDSLINNNHDCWSREVLLKSYRSFIGGYNFLEHVQIPEQSKGRIIDAVARDVGNSIYIDILVATDRKHEELVRDIESGKMSTMSMGCTVDHTTCTKCGNVAHDDKDMCDHIRHQKGSKFYDASGQVHRVAELCGHESYDPDGGVQFIEASWVGTPAFRGAVMRNILTSDLPEEIHKKAETILASPPPEWASDDQIRFASQTGKFGAPKWVPPYFKDRYAFDFGDEGEEEEAPKEKGPEGLEKDIDDTARYIRERAVKKVREEMNRQEKEEALGPEESSVAPNDTLNKEAAKTATEIKKIAFQAGIVSIRDASLSERAALSRLAALNAALDIPVPKYLYRVASVVGASGGYPTLDKFLNKAASVLGRKPNHTEAITLLRIAKILDTINPTRT